MGNVSEHENASPVGKRPGTNLLSNLAVAALSTLLFLAFLEIIVFRHLLLASDVPQCTFENGVIKLKPNQEGIFRIKDEVASHYRINANGWNSGHRRYLPQKRPGKQRVAIIGDSFVEALQVDYDQSVAEELERLNGSETCEVYRFGISWAPLSQYLHMLRAEVLRFSPDVVIVVVVHNDFEQSFNLPLGRYTRSFMRLNLNADHITEVPPIPYDRRWYMYARMTATYRYLVDRRGVNLRGIKRRLLSRESPGNFQANIDIQDLEARLGAIERITDYVLSEFRRISDERDIRILLVMDGARNSIYQGKDSAQLREQGALRLNSLLQAVAVRYHLPFLDLHPVFENDYAVNSKRFNFTSDAHWNEYGHEVVARSLHRWLVENAH